jgi:membrane-bound lytic murein transglycosylase D
MSGTARRYMVVSPAVDERLDPHTAARAAARYLKEAHAELGSWPLAVTSYNHGVDGMKNAIRATGTNDIATVIERYTGPLFGFAGRNFYPELLAVSALAESILQDPGEIVLDRPDAFTTFRLPAYVKLETLAQAMDVSRQDLLALNPSIRGPARRGDAYLPRGMSLNLPEREGLAPEASFASIPASKRPLVEPMQTYRVKRGDTLGGIANRHRTSVATLQRLNGIRDPRRLRVGTVLKLPH